MAIPDWAIEATKYLGSAAVGVIGTKWNERGKRGRMRRHLYKEIANNYGLIRAGLTNARTKEQTVITGVLPEPLHDEYYDHARGQLDTYRELEESYTFDAIYQRMRTVPNDYNDPVKVLTNALEFTGGVERMLENGILDKRLFLKVAPAWVQKLLVHRLAHRQEP